MIAIRANMEEYNDMACEPYFCGWSLSTWKKNLVYPVVSVNLKVILSQKNNCTTTKKNDSAESRDLLHTNKRRPLHHRIWKHCLTCVHMRYHTYTPDLSLCGCGTHESTKNTLKPQRLHPCSWSTLDGARLWCGRGAKITSCHFTGISTERQLVFAEHITTDGHIFIIFAWNCKLEECRWQWWDHSSNSMLSFHQINMSGAFLCTFFHEPVCRGQAFSSRKLYWKTIKKQRNMLQLRKQWQACRQLRIHEK